MFFILFCFLYLKPGSEMFEKGLKYFFSGKYENASEAFSEATTLPSDLTDYIFYYAGKSKLVLGELESAESYFLNIKPDSVWYNYVSSILEYIQIIKNGCKSTSTTDKQAKKYIYSEISDFICSLKTQNNLEIQKKLKKIWLSTYRVPKDGDSKSFRTFRSEIERILLYMTGKKISELLEYAEGDEAADIVTDKILALEFAKTVTKKAEILFELKRYDEALSLLKNLTSKKSLLLKIRILRNLSRDDEAEQLEDIFISRFPESDEARTFLYRRAISLAVDKPTKSKEIFLKLSKTEGTIKDKSIYFLKYLYNQNIDYKFKGYLYLASSFREGKGVLRFDKKGKDTIKVTESTPSPKIFELHNLRSRNPDYKIFDRFILYESDKGLSESDVRFLADEGLYRIVRAKYSGLPLPFFETIKTEAEKNGVPVPLLFGLVLAESEFDPFAVSPAGAIGLAQIMPQTGMILSKAFGIDFRTSMLFDSEINIKFGAKYIGDLFKKYKNWGHAIAAYNAGDDNVDRWISSYRCIDQDLFFELIPFRETRLYVQKVLGYWMQYSEILGGEIPLTEIFRKRC